MQTIAERLKTIQSAIQQAATQCHREPNSVRLLAVSKTKSVSEITQAYELGQRLFAENYVQEGVEKITQMANYKGIEWHMIGPIQSNKSKDVACHFDWVQSIDRAKIAKRLNQQRPDNMAKLNVCIQVNIDNEATKSGVSVEQLPDLIAQVEQCERLTLRGLMAIPSASATGSEKIASLQKMQQLFQQYHTQSAKFDTLSLGMSGDMQQAIEYGSTMVRIGTAIFGARQQAKGSANGA